MTVSAQRDYGVITVEQRDGIRTITVQARQRGLVRPERAVRLGCERYGLDTEIAVLSVVEARALAALLEEVAGDG